MTSPSKRLLLKKTSYSLDSRLMCLVHSKLNLVHFSCLVRFHLLSKHTESTLKVGRMSHFRQTLVRVFVVRKQSRSATELCDGQCVIHT